jgi:diguanylate cyclase (GGDEF)-like protein
MSDPDRTIVAEAIDRLPVGIAVSTEGRSLFANRLGASHAGMAGGRDIAIDGRTLRRHQLSLPIGEGKTCEVVLVFDVTDQLALEDSLFRRAYFDELTALPNRSLVEQTVGAMVENHPDHSFALAFIDLDGFKHINDYYGHPVGDDLLIRLAKRLSAELRPSDVLARLGGDEFVLLLPTATSPEELAKQVQQLLRRLKDPFYIDGHEIFTSASIGVSLYPADGRTFADLCANADSAMYRVKSGTKGGIEFFDAALVKAPSERMRIEQRLRLVIRDRRLCCAYQPKVDFRSGEVKGIEVLLRWRDEQGVVNPPGDFVNLAVDLGLMDEISHFTLAETVAAMDQIDATFGPETSISINVAARQAVEPKFMQSLVEAIDSTGSARRFMLELTEEAFVAGERFQSEILPMVREVGARVSIDDFGVGYSSLSALADITADEIKVDRSFITAIHQRPRSQSVLRAIESLGHALGMSIVVEGVETVEELTYLQATTRIRLAQGYYFARPMLLEDMAVRREVGGPRSAAVARETSTAQLAPNRVVGRTRAG